MVPVFSKACFALIIILGFSVCGNAETGYLIVQVEDLDQQPLAHIRIAVKGNAGSGLSDSEGKLKIKLGANAKEGTGISLTLVSEARPSAYAMLQPLDHRAILPSFVDAPDNFITVILVKRGDSRALNNELFMNVISGGIGRSLANRESSAQVNSRSSATSNIITIDTIARQFGLPPEEVQRAIAEAAERATDPYRRGVAQMATGDFTGAIPTLLESLKNRERLNKSSSQDVFDVAKNLAYASHAIGMSPEALVYVDRALEIQPDDPGALETKGLCLQSLHRYKEAEIVLEKALADEKKLVEKDSPYLGPYQDNLANVAIANGNLAHARELLESSARLYANAFGENSLQFSDNAVLMAFLYEKESHQALTGGPEWISQSNQPSAPRTTRSIDMKDLREAADKQALAETSASRAISIRSQQKKVILPAVAQAQDVLAEILADDYDDVGARQCNLAAVAIWKTLMPEQAHALASSLIHLSIIAAGFNEFQESQELLEESRTAFEKRARSDDLLFAAMLMDFSQRLLAEDRGLQVIPLLQTAYKIRRDTLGPDNALTKDSYRTLLIWNPQIDPMQPTVQPSYRSTIRPDKALDISSVCRVPNASTLQNLMPATSTMRTTKSKNVPHQSN